MHSGGTPRALVREARPVSPRRLLHVPLLSRRADRTRRVRRWLIDVSGSLLNPTPLEERRPSAQWRL